MKIQACANIPAIEGGYPVRQELLDYSRPHLGEGEMKAALEVLKGKWLTMGPAVHAFEERFKRWLGTNHALAVSSGTAALSCATFAAGFGPGDEVITTPMTFVATANAIVYRGAKPVFADIDPRTLCLDPAAIESRLTSKTRGIIVVHFGGQPAEMDAILEIASARNLTVIEDACHAPGAAYRGRAVGTLGDMACFSFHPVKPIATGEGGLIATANEEFARKMALFRNHGIMREPAPANSWEYDVVTAGENYRLSDLHCAIGVVQLERLPESLERRAQIAALYDEAFRELDSVELPCRPAHTKHGWHLYQILLRLERLRVTRKQIFDALRAENLGVNVHYIPVHRHSWYRKEFGSPGGLPHAEGVYERLITLPLFFGITDQDAADVIHAVKKVLQYYRA